jgi:hypothetical protein
MAVAGQVYFVLRGLRLGLDEVANGKSWLLSGDEPRLCALLSYRGFLFERRNKLNLYKMEPVWNENLSLSKNLSDTQDME